MSALEIDRLSVWLPGRGTVLDDLSVETSGLTLVVGRSGSGATTLLHAASGRLPSGSRVRGRITLAGTDLLGSTVDELAGLVASSHLTALPDLTVAEVAPRGLALARDFGLDPAARLSALQRSGRAAVRLVRALTQATAGVVLLDQPLQDLAPGLRQRACTAIRALADAGVEVLWAEHLLEDALAVADRVLELGGRRVGAVARDEWNPATLPAPPAMALARSLGLPRSVWADPSALLTEADSSLPVQSRTSRPSMGLAAAAPAVTGLDREVVLRDGECVGVVGADRDRAIDLARRLAAVARGARSLEPLPVVPRTGPVGSLVARWERARGVAPGTVSSWVGPLARISGSRSLSAHSAGEATALHLALSFARPGARALVDPTRGLDPEGRRRVARLLYDDTTRPTFLVTDDVEVLTRACHRVLVVANGTLVADGAPLALVDHLPAHPQLVRMGLRRVRVGAVGTGSLREVAR